MTKKKIAAAVVPAGSSYAHAGARCLIAFLAIASLLAVVVVDACGGHGAEDEAYLSSSRLRQVREERGLLRKAAAPPAPSSLSSLSSSSSTTTTTTTTLHSEMRNKDEAEELGLDHNGVDERPSPPCKMKVTQSEKEEMNRAFLSWSERRLVQQQQVGSDNNADNDRILLFDNNGLLGGRRYKIPVHFVVFQPSQGVGKIGTDRQDELISTLNHGFRDTPFEFHALYDPEHVVDKRFSECGQEKRFRKKYRVQRADTLSVFFCDSYSRGAVGFTYPPVVTEKRPDLDGVVLMNPTLFDENDAKEELLVSQVLIHEVGHWLGLLHTWEDGCSGEAEWQRKFGGVEYYFQQGDGVSDTPNHKNSTWDYPGEHNCWLDTTTNLKKNGKEKKNDLFIPTPILNTCSDRKDGVDSGPDPVDNYMNYISGRCFQQHGRFTPGQKLRMLAQYETYRKRVYCLDYGNEVEQAAKVMPMNPRVVVAETLSCAGEGDTCYTTTDCCSGDPPLVCVKDDDDDEETTLREQLTNTGRCLPCE